MKNITVLFLVSILVFNSCKKDETTAPSDIVIVTPTQLSPSNGAVVEPDSILFKWRKVIGVTSYAIQIFKDSNSSISVYDRKELIDTIVQIEKLDSYSTYFWRVRSVLYDAATPWSIRSRFTTTYTACPNTPTVTYDGKTYNTVKIGNQCWLKENLDVGIKINGIENQTNNGTVEKYCYNDSIENCNKYGGLYQWSEAIKYSTVKGAQGICPNGWHIPTVEEFLILNNNVFGDANALKEIGQGIYGGAGTNTNGFSALLSGIRNTHGSFDDFGSFPSIWSSTETYPGLAFHMTLFGGSNSARFEVHDKDLGFNVRCVKD
jgi:uncharacterized protein (TIGR02145 family)